MRSCAGVAIFGIELCSWQAREVEYIEDIKIFQLVRSWRILTRRVIRFCGVMRLARNEKVQVICTPGRSQSSIVRSRRWHTHLRMSARMRTVEGVTRSPEDPMLRPEC
jgi:hypothetical protein